MMSSSKDKFWVFLFTGIMFLSLSSLGFAASIGVDFGATTAPDHWNLYMGSTLNNMIDMDDQATTVGFEFTDKSGYGGTNYNGPENLEDALGLPTRATRDSYYGTTTPFLFTVFGLDPESTYKFTFFGLRMFVSDNRDTAFTMSGLISDYETVYLDTAANTENVVTSSPVTPNEDGEILIEVGQDPNKYRWVFLY